MNPGRLVTADITERGRKPLSTSAAAKGKQRKRRDGRVFPQPETLLKHITFLKEEARQSLPPSGESGKKKNNEGTIS